MSSPEPLTDAEIAANEFASINGLDRFRVILKPEEGDKERVLSHSVVVLEYEDSETQNCRIVLNAKGGRYLAGETEAGETEEIQKWDRIYVEIVDRDGYRVQDLFHVRTRNKQLQPGKGLQLELECPHISSNLWTQTISIPSRRRSGLETLNSIIHILNLNRGNLDPFVQSGLGFGGKHALGLSDDTSNDYIFESVKLKQALDEIRRIELNPVEGGGQFEPVILRFKARYIRIHETLTDANMAEVLDKYDPQKTVSNEDARNFLNGAAAGIVGDLAFVFLQAYPLGRRYTGDRTTQQLTRDPADELHHEALQDGGAGTRPNILSMKSNLEVEQGTNLIAIGERKAGSLPTNHARYFSAEETFFSARPWSVTATYMEGALVRLNEKVYECNVDRAITGRFVPSEWTEREFTKPPEWKSTNTYQPGDVVQWEGVAYRARGSESNIGISPATNRRIWRRIAYLPTDDASPLTSDWRHWLNAMAGAEYHNDSRLQMLRTCVVDPNVIIKDQFHPRTWVDRLAAKPDDIPIQEQFGGSPPEFYRLLVVDPEDGSEPELDAKDWAGSRMEGGVLVDPNSVPISGRVVELVEGRWEVITFIECNDDQEIFEWQECRSWTKNPVTSGFTYADNNSMSDNASRTSTWQQGAYHITEVGVVADILGLIRDVNLWLSLSSTYAGNQSGFNDALKIWDETAVLEQDEGKQILIWFPNINFNCVHSPDWEADIGRVALWNDDIVGNASQPKSGLRIRFFSRSFDPGAITNTLPDLGGYRGINTQFAGLNFAFPWPRSWYGYGKEEDVTRPLKMPAMDFFNMDLDHDGRRTWHGRNVEDFYPIQSWAFFHQLRVTLKLALGANDPFGANYRMGLWMCDRHDNVVILNYNHDRNTRILPKDVSLANREYYYGVPGNAVGLAPSEPERFRIFSDRRVIRGGIFTREAFDENGRFYGQDILGRNPLQWAHRFGIGLDYLRLTKPLVATNIDHDSQKDDRNIEPQKIQQENISHYNQLKHFVLGLAQQMKFVRDAYTVHTAGRCKAEHGDPVSLRVDRAVPEEELAVEKITYSISKPTNGPGGFTRDIHLIKRLYKEDLE